MKACRDLCPILKVQRCCFMCPDRQDCDEVCCEDSNDLCELLVDIPDDSAEVLAEPIMRELKDILQRKAQLEILEKSLKEKLKAHMESTQSTSFKSNSLMKVSYIAANETMTFNSDLFKKSEPALYAHYCNKPKKTSAYIKCELLDKKGKE